MRLVEYLADRKESQSAFARRTGIPQSTINLLCTGGGGARVETAYKIIKATGGLVALEDLLPPSDTDGAAA